MHLPHAEGRVGQRGQRVERRADDALPAHAQLGRAIRQEPLPVSRSEGVQLVHHHPGRPPACAHPRKLVLLSLTHAALRVHQEQEQVRGDEQATRLVRQRVIRVAHPRRVQHLQAALPGHLPG
ncbi:MAG: hypothetical protein ACK559_05310, partial [bacterium]